MSINEDTKILEEIFNNLSFEEFIEIIKGNVNYVCMLEEKIKVMEELKELSDKKIEILESINEDNELIISNQEKKIKIIETLVKDK